MTTDDLIAQLTRDLRPVRRLVDPRARVAQWVATAAVGLLVGLMYFGVRHDLATASGSALFVARATLLAATAWLAVVTCIRLSIPGADLRAWRRWWPLVTVGSVLALGAGELTYALLLGDAGSPLRSWTCVRKVAVAGTFPAIAAVLLIRQGASLEPRWTAMVGMLAAAASGALTAELACPITQPMHTFLWHLVPTIVVAGLGLVAGEVWVRRRRGR